MPTKIYTVYELYYTLQGEGVRTGSAAVFCRFSGCNLWSGRELHRAQAVCRFCDTAFVGVSATGGKFSTAAALADAVACCWATHAEDERWVVCTGGEPLLQLDPPLIEALHQRGFKVAVETNGTCAAPPGLDWLCVSPKADAPLVQRCGDELKLVYPQARLAPPSLEHLAFQHFLLQPLDDAALADNTALAVAYCLAHPHWRLSLQTHKLLGIP
jgi:7-carboxy-7-deazaguanine synthase (Cx14CxxC type)